MAPSRLALNTGLPLNSQVNLLMILARDQLAVLVLALTRL